MKWSCEHTWEVKDKTILPSAWEQSKATSMEGISLWFFQKMVVIILVCTKCGDLDKTVETNPS